MTPPVLPGSANSRVAMPYRSAVLDSPMSGVAIGMGNNYAYVPNNAYQYDAAQAAVAIPHSGQSGAGQGQGHIAHSVHSMTAAHMPQLSGLNISHHGGGSVGGAAHTGSHPSHYSYDGYAAQY